MAKGDLNVNREGPRTKGPAGRRPNENFLFGSEEEITGRGDDLLMVPGAVNPSGSPTSFNAIKPEVSTGRRSVNRAPLQYRRQDRDYNEGGGPGRP